MKDSQLISNLTQKRRVFVCHSSEDKVQAVAINRVIENSLKDTDSFCSSDVESIPYGDWFDRIILELRSADALVIIASANSVHQNWVNFEFGAYFALHGKASIHILSLDSTKLPDPLGRLQAKDAQKADALRAFFEGLSNSLKTPIVGQPLYEKLSEALIPSANIDVGVIGGIKTSAAAPSGELPKSAEADENGQFTLMFRNNGSDPIEGIVLRISGWDESGANYRLSGIDNVHIAPKTEYQELETTDKWTEIGANTVEQLCMQSFGDALDTKTVKIRIEFKKCNLRRKPNPFEVSVTFPSTYFEASQI